MPLAGLVYLCLRFVFHYISDDSFRTSSTNLMQVVDSQGSPLFCVNNGGEISQSVLSRSKRGEFAFFTSLLDNSKSSISGITAKVCVGPDEINFVFSLSRG